MTISRENARDMDNKFNFNYSFN